MKRSRFTEDRFIGILEEQEAGVSVAVLHRKPGVRVATVYKWKAKYGGVDVSEAKQLKGLLGKLYSPPRYCKVFPYDRPACVNVSGL